MCVLTSTCLSVCKHAIALTYVNLYVCMYVHVRTYVCMNERTFVRMYVCMYVSCNSDKTVYHIASGQNFLCRYSTKKLCFASTFLCVCVCVKIRIL